MAEKKSPKSINKTKPKKTFSDNVIARISFNKIEENTNNQFATIVNGVDSKMDVIYDSNNSIDIVSINNFAIQNNMNIATIEKIFDQIDSNNLVQNDVLLQPKLNENNVTFDSFVFDDSTMYFEDSTKFYNSNAFTIHINFIISENQNTNNNFLFCLADIKQNKKNIIYGAKFNGQNIDIIVNDSVITSVDFQYNQNIDIGLIYDSMENIQIFKNKLQTGIFNINNSFLKSGVFYLGLYGSNFNLNKFNAFNFSILKSKFDML